MDISFIRSGVAKNLILVTDIHSKNLAMYDRSTIMLFGYGAAVSWIGQVDDCRTKLLNNSFNGFCGHPKGVAGTNSLSDRAQADSRNPDVTNQITTK